MNNHTLSLPPPQKKRPFFRPCIFFRYGDHLLLTHTNYVDYNGVGSSPLFGALQSDLEREIIFRSIKVTKQGTKVTFNLF